MYSTMFSLVFHPNGKVLLALVRRVYKFLVLFFFMKHFHIFQILFGKSSQDILGNIKNTDKNLVNWNRTISDIKRTKPVINFIDSQLLFPWFLTCFIRSAANQLFHSINLSHKYFVLSLSAVNYMINNINVNGK